jgi:invasion protein IalB
MVTFALISSALIGAANAPAQQQPAAKPAQPAKPAAKPAPAKPAAQAQPQAQQPGQPAAPQGQAAAQTQQLPIVYSPWTKFCGKDQNQASAKEVCLTVREARMETGQFVAGAALIEQEGEQKKILRITLPLGMQLNPGTRIIVDKEQPLTGRYVVCLPNGCMADFEVNQDFVGKLKKGQTLVLQSINIAGQAASYPIPLTEFAKTNEGPPTDPKVFEEQQKKLQEELQRRADEARKKLEQQPPTGAPSAAAPGAAPK